MQLERAAGFEPVVRAVAQVDFAYYAEARERVLEQEPALVAAQP